MAEISMSKKLQNYKKKKKQQLVPKTQNMDYNQHKWQLYFQRSWENIFGRTRKKIKTVIIELQYVNNKVFFSFTNDSLA